MVRTLAILLLAVSALGQGFTYEDLAYMGRVSTPTSAWSFSALPNLEAWWDVSASSYTSNGTTRVTLADATGHGHGLTNAMYGGAYWPVRVAAGVDGHDYLQYGSTDHGSLQCANLVNNHPTEVWMVIKQTSVNSTYVFSTVASSPTCDAYRDYASSPYKYIIYNGSSATFDASVADKWFVFMAQLAPGAGRALVRTNNVNSAGPGNAGATTVMDGFTLCGKYDRTEVRPWQIAEVAVFSSTNDPATRVKIFNYFTNRYVSVHNAMWGL